MRAFVKSIAILLLLASACFPADLRKLGSTSNVVRFVLTDSSSSSGAGLTGLTSASSGLIINTIADNEATGTAYAVASSKVEAVSTLGTFVTPTATKCRFKEVDATNSPGLYEFQFADARFAVSSAKRMIISVTGATNLKPANYEIQLLSVDPYDGTKFGMTRVVANVDQFGGTAGTFASGIPVVVAQNTGKTYYVAGNAYGTITLSSPAATITLAAKAAGSATGTEGNGVKTIVVSQNASESTSYNTGTDALTVAINISGGHNTVQDLINVINAGSVFYAWPLTGTTSTITTSTTGTGTLAKGVAGSDSNSGLTQSAPFATPLQATLTVVPGDKVHLMAGAHGDVIVATDITTWEGEGDATLLHNLTMTDVDGTRLLHFRVDGSQTANLHGIVATNFSSSNYRTLYMEGINTSGDDDGFTVANCRWLEMVGCRSWGHNTSMTGNNITGRATGCHFSCDSTFASAAGHGVRCQASVRSNMQWVNCDFYPQRANAASNNSSGFVGCGHHTFIGCRFAPAATHASNTGEVNGIKQDTSATGLDATLIGCSFLGLTNSGSGATKQINTSVSATKVRLSSTPYTAALLGTGVETDSISTPGETLTLSSGKVSPANGSITGSTFDGSTAVAQTGDSYARLGAPAHTTVVGDIANVASSGGSGGGPIQQQGAPHILTVRDRGDGNFDVIGSIKQKKSEVLLYALEFKGTQLPTGQNLYGMSAPTVSGDQAAHGTIGSTAGTDYGVDHTQAKFLFTTTSSAAADDDISVDVTVQLTPTQTITVSVPVTIGG